MIVLDPAVMVTAFLAGLLGSGHCFGMCGGIAAGLGAELDQDLDVAKVVPADRALVEEMAPRPFGDQQAVFDLPSARVLRGLPTLERLAVEQRRPIVGRQGG